MSTVMAQRCFHCGEPMGTFAHSERYDGVLHCGDRECAQAASDEERDRDRSEREEAQEAAHQDDYGRYR